CVDCHMKGGSHRFDVSRNPSFLRNAIAITDVKVTDHNRAVAITLTPRNVGHAFPTGDMFRRLVVRTESASSSPPASAARTLARGFGPAATAAKKQMTSDTRLFRETTITLPRKASDRYVRVYYQRLISAGMSLPSAPANAAREDVEDEILLVEAEIPLTL